MILKNRGGGVRGISSLDASLPPRRRSRTADLSARAASPSGAKAPDYGVSVGITRWRKRTAQSEERRAKSGLTQTTTLEVDFMVDLVGIEPTTSSMPFPAITLGVARWSERE
jgi:hypothetical protein